MKPTGVTLIAVLFFSLAAPAHADERLLGGVPFRRVSGMAEFQVNGYWMRVVDPWPESWPDGWASHDPVHVSTGDGGYYLFNRYYPKTPLALEFITR